MDEYTVQIEDISNYIVFFENCTEERDTFMNEHISNYNAFFNNCTKELNAFIKDHITEYEASFNHFANYYSIIIDEKKRTDNIEAWDFSLFDILKFARPEENLHSPILTSLLDSKGSHGQKDLFYKLFLQTILPENEVNKYINQNHADYFIKMEDHIDNGNNQGRIDIVIKSTSQKRFAVIIENKWYSPDSCPDQLYKYYTYYTKTLKYKDVNLLVIYLTNHGNDPSWVESDDFNKFINTNKWKNYFPISYSYHIRNWLISCYNECESNKVKIIIEEYLKII